MAWVVVCSHDFCALRSARSFRIWWTSCRQHCRCARKSLRLLESMCFVNVSASWAAECTQCILVPFWTWSLITNASIKVLCSWHWGVAFLTMTSYRDLQSVTAMLGWLFFHTFSGSFQGTMGFSNHSQLSLIQSKRSIAWDKANVSAARVLATTRDIFLEYHTMGLAPAGCWFITCRCAARIIPPFWLCCFSLDAKDASE